MTSNLACISIAMAFENSCRTVLLENHYQKNSLENMLIHRQEKRQARNAVNISRYKGLEHIINQVSKDWTKDRIHYNEIQERTVYEEICTLNDPHSSYRTSFYMEDEKLMKEASFEILINSLYYVPIGNHFNQFIFDYTLNDNIIKILQASENFASYTFIDTSNENHLSSKIILEEADLIVVTLAQDQKVIKEFFRNYSSLLSKCIILLSEYRNDTLKVQAISEKYSFHMSKIVQIPYNMEYSQAIEQGAIVEFMTRNYGCEREDSNYPFITGVRHAAAAIQREENRDRKEKWNE
ncbi:hypothetical protein [Anaerocolumna xylanovorans]|uniref:Uncharacterized protein n=1 Tax=Anaerocolumna xylanovorans DSM 12503 TaxID=1121345 RepID=A0A1M7Y479_9FIRM|nr:hypothetical protein [Anaerocolumna xylanovorans]SHO47042.1 hypothetical protein SAMN02745217_01375 [Anaerocolumna xylanovorans DSM 12503]